jgi:hypothetical protein
MKPAVAAGGILTAGALYAQVLRKPILSWGATSTEVEARLPGDELLEHADGVSTRAITIDAPAAAVWPWLAQMGPSPRGDRGPGARAVGRGRAGSRLARRTADGAPLRCERRALRMRS